MNQPSDEKSPGSKFTSSLRDELLGGHERIQARRQEYRSYAKVLTSILVGWIIGCLTISRSYIQSQTEVFWVALLPCAIMLYGITILRIAAKPRKSMELEIIVATICFGLLTTYAWLSVSA
jgi:uncharacterized membrane protein YadS